MNNLSRLTKAELIAEIEQLRTQYEECSDAADGNGKFDEDELFQLAGEIEGDELFLVSETGRFVFVNDGMLDQLGYTKEQMLEKSLPRLDRLNTRAQWLGRVSRLKQTGEPEMFESEQTTDDGSIAYKEITARYVNYRSRNYVLCVGREIVQAEEDKRTPSSIKTREETLLQMTSDGVMLVDTRGMITETNSVADRLLGISKNEIIGRSCTDTRWRLVDVAGAPLGISSHPVMVALVEEQQVFNRRVDMLDFDGSRRSLLVNASPLHDADGELIGAIGCIRPFDDSAERGDQLQRQKMLQAMEREVMDLVMHGGSEADLERRVCQLLVRHGGYPLVWRGVTEEKDERLHPSASAGEQSDYLMKVKIRYDDSARGRGPLGKAMKSGAPVAVADTLSDSSYEPWRKQAERSNLHSLLAIPLNYDNANYGLLTLYAQDRNHFVGVELKSLTTMASLFAYGLAMRSARDGEDAQKEAFAVQQKTLEMMHGSVTAAVAMFDDREPFRCIEANDGFLALLDEPYKTSGIEGYHVTDFMYSTYHRDIYQRLQEAADSGEAVGEENALFTDWQGEEMRWTWRLERVSGVDGSDRLLYIAIRKDAGQTDAGQTDAGQTDAGQTDAGQTDAGQTDAGQTASPEAVSDEQDHWSTKNDPFLMMMTYPTVGPRSKAETRISRFLEQGRVTEANTPAEDWFGGDDTIVGTAVSTLFGDERYQPFLAELLTLKESGATLALPHPDHGGLTSCRAFFAAEDKDTQRCLLAGVAAAAPHA